MLTLGRQLRKSARRKQIGNGVNCLFYIMKNQHFAGAMQPDQGCAAFWHIGTREWRRVIEQWKVKRDL